MELIRKGGQETLAVRKKGDVIYLTFPSFEEAGGIAHLVSTRYGGVSKGEFASLNFSYTRGDDKEAVDKNFKTIAAVLNRMPEDMVCADQTHTVTVRTVTRQDRGKGVVRERDFSQTDGLITNEPGIVLATFYADCVPLFIYDKKNKAIGLSHSGWKGTLHRMGRETLLRMKEEYGTNPKDVLVGIGPSICSSCYEVGADVTLPFMERFQKMGEMPSFLKEIGGGKYLLDLWRANEQIFEEAGVPAARITVTDICTCCNKNHLFSHRGSKGRRGNLGAFLSLEV